MKKIKLICLMLAALFLLTACTAQETPSSTARWGNSETLTYTISQTESFSYASIAGAQLKPASTEGTYVTSISVGADNATTFLSEAVIFETYLKISLNNPSEHSEFIHSSTDTTIIFKSEMRSEVKFGAFPKASPISSRKTVKGVVVIKDGDAATVYANHYQTTVSYSEKEIASTLYGWNALSGKFDAAVENTQATLTTSLSAGVIDNEQLLLSLRATDMKVLADAGSTTFKSFNATAQTTQSLTATLTKTDYKTILTGGTAEIECYSVSLKLNANGAGAATTLNFDKNGTMPTAYYGDINKYVLVEMLQGHLRFLLDSSNSL